MSIKKHFRKGFSNEFEISDHKAKALKKQTDSKRESRRVKDEEYTPNPKYKNALKACYSF